MFKIEIKNFFLVGIFYFFVFPFLRVVSIGGHEADGVFSMLITLSPDIILFFVLLYSMFIFPNKWLEVYQYHKISIGLFISIVGYGAVMNVLTGTHFLALIYGVRICYFPVLFYFFYKIFDKKDLMVLVNKIFNGIVIYTIASIIFHLVYFDYEKYLIEVVNGRVMSEYFIPRTGGFLLTPVPFAVINALAGIYFSYEFIFNEKLNAKKKFFLLIKLMIVYVGITMSVSRAGIIGFLIVNTVMLLLNMQYWKKILVVSGLFYFTFSLILYLYTLEVKSLIWAFASTSETVRMTEGVSRVELWKKSYKTLLSHPFGYGIGKAGAGAVKYFGSAADAAVYTTDGWFLKIWNELGIITGSIFIGLLVFFSKIRLKGSFDKRYSYLLLFIWLNALVNNIYDFYPYNLIFYLFMSLNNFAE